MNVINNIKEKIDFTLFQIGCQYRRGNFSSIIPYIENCQSYINKFENKTYFQNSDEDKEKIKKIKEKVIKRISKLEKERNQRVAQGKDTSNLNFRIEELKTAVYELEFLENTATRYIFKKNKNAPQINYKGDNVIEVQHGNLDSILHELHHAFQYETGKIDFIKTDDGDYIPGFLYDTTDELSAYKRQFAFDGILKVAFKIKEKDMLDAFRTKQINTIIQEDKEYFGVKEIIHMKDITIDVIIKIAEPKIGNLYKNISSKELNSKSSLSDIINNNTYKSGYLNEFGFHKENPNKSYIEFVKIFITETPRIYVKE